MFLHITIENLLLVVAGALLLAVMASKVSSKLGVPALLMFILLGMLAGSEGPGGIYFDDPRPAQFLGVIALAFILFAGGLDTDWRRIRPVLGRGIVLSTLAVLVSAVLVGLFSTYVLGFTWLEGLLLGAIVSSTDAAAVFSVLRSKSISFKGRTKDLLELESGSNDPMAVFLTIGVIRVLTEPGTTLWELAWMFVVQMALGALLGYLAGHAAVYLLNHLRLEYEGLYPVLSMALVALTYGGTAAVEGNGFLAVYVAGLVMGNREFIHKRSLRVFHDGVAWLMQITMFIVLGLLVFPSDLVRVAGVGLASAVFLMFVARPASILGVLAFDRMRFRQKLMIAWVGLRGAVPIILATFPLLAGVEKAKLIFDIVFFIVLTSVLVQGTTVPVVARWLSLATPFHRKHEYPIEFVPKGNMETELIELEVRADSPAVGRSLVEMRLPRGALVVLMNRGEEFVVPRGSTLIEAGDRVLVLADKRSREQVEAALGAAPPAAEEG